MNIDLNKHPMNNFKKHFTDIGSDMESCKSIADGRFVLNCGHESQCLDGFPNTDALLQALFSFFIIIQCIYNMKYAAFNRIQIVDILRKPVNCGFLLAEEL